MNSKFSKLEFRFSFSFLIVSIYFLTSYSPFWALSLKKVSLFSFYCNFSKPSRILSYLAWIKSEAWSTSTMMNVLISSRFSTFLLHSCTLKLWRTLLYWVQSYDVFSFSIVLTFLFSSSFKESKSFSTCIVNGIHWNIWPNSTPYPSINWFHEYLYYC